jgi:hypothetical protein
MNNVIKKILQLYFDCMTIAIKLYLFYMNKICYDKIKLYKGHTYEFFFILYVHQIDCLPFLIPQHNILYIL